MIVAIGFGCSLGGDCRASTVLVAIGFVCGRGGLVSVVCGPLRWLLVVVAAEDVGHGLRVVGSSPTVVVWGRCDRTRREGIPARLYRINTHGIHFILCVCVCLSVGPVCK